jgi:hypothetical protein
MAKPLGPKSLLIREAIKNNPDLGNTALAELINRSDTAQKDKIKVTGNDIAQQRQALKKLGEAAPAKKGAGKKGGKAAPKAAASQPSAPMPTSNQAGPNPLEVARQVKELVDRYGAETVKGLAELFGGN